VSAASRATEAEMLVLLRQRYTEKAGNGDAWAFMTHVRDAAAFNARRTADAIAMSLWPSRGLELIGHEIKVSRSDWVRELKQPEKAEAFCELVDRWYVVVSDAEIVKPGELPETWGLIVKQGSRLVCKKEAPALRDLTTKPPISRSFLVCLLRAAGLKASAEPEAIIEAREAGRAEAQVAYDHTTEHMRDQITRYQQERQAFRDASGVSLDWFADQNGRTERIGQTLKLVLEGDSRAEELERRIRMVVAQAENVAAAGRQVLEGRLV
jgi:hypothetical protein